MFIRRITTLTSKLNSNLLLQACGFSSSASRVPLVFQNEQAQSSFIDCKKIKERNDRTRLPLLQNLASGDDKGSSSTNYDSRLHLSPWFSGNKATDLEDYKIELVDVESWRVSSGPAEAWRGNNGMVEREAAFAEENEEVVEYLRPDEEDPDFDEIVEMRIRGNLFYKLDRDSKEFEEYSFDFHRRKSVKNKTGQRNSKNNENPRRILACGVEKSKKYKNEGNGTDKENVNHRYAIRGERLPRVDKEGDITMSFREMDSFGAGKKQRTPTFNQITAPYHEPFCLDIFISNASARACIIHRATSKVVAVAHTISKDMKFDLASTKNRLACAAVGKVLAQRALADDIYNVVYTPRKGERLEGKLQIVLQSIVDNGVDVKVKIKQRKSKKAGLPSAAKVHC